MRHKYQHTQGQRQDERIKPIDKERALAFQRPPNRGAAAREAECIDRRGLAPVAGQPPPAGLRSGHALGSA